MRPLMITYTALFGASMAVAMTTTNNGDPIYSTKELYNLTTAFFDAFIYPNNCVQSQSINSTLFADDIEGRIDATRTFVGAELNTEYVFGMFCNVAVDGSFSLFGSPINYTITQFVGHGNLVATTALIYFNASSVGLVSPGTLQVYFNFDVEGRIYQYDGIFKWVDWEFSTVFAAVGELLGSSNATKVQDDIAGLIAENICTVADQYCIGDLQQYDTTENCLAFLTEDIPFGESWQLGMNTLTCRDVHVNMVHLRPDVHCAHIGPTGGGYCTNDRGYAEYISSTFFTDEQAMLQIG